MIWTTLANGLALLGLVIAHEETICLATYGGAVTSVPSPGRDILIQVVPDSRPLAPRGTSDQGYLDFAGQIQIACQAGSVFRLVSGLLYFNGDQISVSKNVPEQRLNTSAHIQAIDSIFAIAGDGTLVWNNDAFDDGTARFGADSTGLYGVFHGVLPSQLTAVSLRAIDPSECPISTQSLSSIPVFAPSSGFPDFPASYTNTTRSILSTTRANSSASALWTVSSRPLPYSASSVSSNVTSFMSASSTVMSKDLVAEASFVIAKDDFWSFCTSLPGYSTENATATIITVLTTDTIITTRPINDNATVLVLTTVRNTQTVPSDTVLVTPTISEYVTTTHIDTITYNENSESIVYTPKESERRRNIARSQNLMLNVTNPPPLQTFASNILSSACSENVVKVTQFSNVTTTSISIVVRTLYSTLPFATFNSTILINATSTSVFGDYSSTVAPFTANFSKTTIETTTINVRSHRHSPTVVLASPTMVANNTTNAPIPVGNNVTNFTSVTATSTEDYDVTTEDYDVTATSVVTIASSQCTLGSTYIAADDSTNFAESCSTDFVGYEADSSIGATFEACMDQCAQMNDNVYGSCVGISYDRTNLTCSLKYGILVEERPSITIDSARITDQGSCIDGVTQWGDIFLPSNGDSYTIFCAINDPGYDTAPQCSSGANSTDTCAQDCTNANNEGGINAGAGDVPCVGAAYVPHYSAGVNCCLKTAIPPDNFATRAYIVDTARLNPQG